MLLFVNVVVVVDIPETGGIEKQQQFPVWGLTTVMFIIKVI